MYVMQISRRSLPSMMSSKPSPFAVPVPCCCCFGVTTRRLNKKKIKLTFSCPAVECFLFLSPTPSAELISHPPIIVDLVPLMQCCRSYLMMYHLSNCCGCSLPPNCNSGPRPARCLRWTCVHTWMLKCSWSLSGPELSNRGPSG